MSRKVIKIPSKIDFDMIKPLNVGIYCRVSSTKQDQLHSLSAQVSYYIKTVLNCPLWKYVDIYIDFDSGASAYKRPELQRLINDCERGIVNTILASINESSPVTSLCLSKPFWIASDISASSNAVP